MNQINNNLTHTPYSIIKGGSGGIFNNQLKILKTQSINIIEDIKNLSVKISCPTGYTHCYEQNYIYGNAQAMARVYVSDPYIENGSLYINYKCDGTKFYAYRGITSWSQVSCDSNGCNGTNIGSSGRILLGTAPSTNQAGICFVVWDYNSYGGYWAWTWVGFGWHSPFNYDLRSCTTPTCSFTVA